MPTTELDKAAQEASEALGMEVVLTLDITEAIDISVQGPLDDEDNGLPTSLASGMLKGRALVYLEGLEAGARIQREQHRPLVEAVQSAFHGTDTFNLDRIGALKRALVQLED